MTSHRAQDTVYVELPPFEPSETNIGHRSGGTRRREAEDSGAEDSQGNDIIDLPSHNPFAATGREPRAKSFRGEREDSRGNGVVHLSSVNPFAASGRESRVTSAPRRGRNASESEQDEEGDRDDGVTVLSVSNPFAASGREIHAKSAPRRGRNASESEQDEEDERDDGITVLTTANPFAGRGRGSATGRRSSGAGGHRGEVIVDLPSYDPFTRRGGRVPASGRRDDSERGGDNEDTDDVADEDNDGSVVTLSNVNPFAARRL
ncbi:hypothetical protein FRC08_003707 [Ceratobasidium sp. 394]|nr:hypothetical protein FRC08_003707 [Ceratobasidium sp. 394]